nr:immunoglobulin heavy chain junction region [Macaca mulatta]
CARDFSSWKGQAYW